MNELPPPSPPAALSIVPQVVTVAVFAIAIFYLCGFVIRKRRETPSPKTSTFQTKVDKTGAASTPANGVWWWTAYIAYHFYSEINNIKSSTVWFGNHNVALGYLFFTGLGFLISLAVCTWWYSRSKLLGRRSSVLQALGFLFFAVGTVAPMAITKIVIVTGQTAMTEIWSIVMLAVVSAACIASAYYLVFRPTKPSARP